MPGARVLKTRKGTKKERHSGEREIEIEIVTPPACERNREKLFLGENIGSGAGYW